MKKQRLIWQLFSPLWLITILALLAATIFISHYFKKIYLEQAAEDLQAQAFFARSFLYNFIIDGNEQAADSLCEYLGRETDTRLTVILRTGRVIGDSRGDPANMTDHSNRPEIAAAFDDETGISTRYSYTLHISLMYVAVPVRVEDQIVGVVRASKPISAINEALVGINVKIAIGWLVIVLLIVFTGFIGSRRLNASLKQMQQGAQQYSGGDFSYRLPEQSSFELSQLTGAMNRMAFELDSRIRTILQQRNEQQAVLSSMVEGVMAIDRNERIINLNSAAENLLGVSCDQAKNCYVHEAIRNTQLQKFVRKALVAAEPIEGNITIYDEGEKSIQAHGAILRDAGGNNVGAVIVLNDMTRLRKLENIRREFVANVSHELKTPITAIKGFVETLMDGAVKNPGDTEQFLQVVLKHANRLNAIIDDLLKLSRI
jgi:two-component system phosphate regulon sensor histidine kinase PhoR